MGLKQSFLVRCSMARYKRHKPVKPSYLYRQIWRVVDGSICDTLLHHPEYFRDHLSQSKDHISNFRRSLCKRITGAVLASVEQSAKRRSRAPWAADEVDAFTMRAETAGALKCAGAVGPLDREGTGSAATDPVPYDWMADFSASYHLAIASTRREGLITGRFEPMTHSDFLETLRS